MTFDMKENRVVIASPPDYEQLVAEIFVGDVCVAIISRDTGDEDMHIELLVEHEPKKGVPLDVFLELVAKGKSILLGYERV